MLAVVPCITVSVLASLSTTRNIYQIKKNANYPPKILSMVGEIRKDAMTRVAAISRNVIAPLVIITVALLRFSFLLLSASWESDQNSMNLVRIQ